MLRYLKAAFLLRADLPGLGAVPLNVLAVLGIAVAGLWHPGLWVAGAGLELGYLLFLGGSRRFQAVIDAQHLVLARQAALEREQLLLVRLPEDLQVRHRRLQDTITRALGRLTESNLPPVVRSREQVLRQLGWSHLKLLVAQQHLLDDGLIATRRPANRRGANADDPAARLADLERELADPAISVEVRQAKEQTRDLLVKRVAARDRANAQLDRILAEVERIETQVTLVFEQSSAPLPEGLDSDLQVAGILLDDDVFGDQQDAVKAIERAYVKA